MFLNMCKHNKIKAQFFFFFFFLNPLNLFSHARDQLRPISTNQTKIRLNTLKHLKYI